jgi:hypothetical protein
MRLATRQSSVAGATTLPTSHGDKDAVSECFSLSGAGYFGGSAGGLGGDGCALCLACAALGGGGEGVSWRVAVKAGTELHLYPCPKF